MSQRISLRRGPVVIEAVEPRKLFTISFLPAVQSMLGSLSVVATGDFNHDGLADVVAKSTTNGSVNFFAGMGDGRFTPTNAATPVDAGRNVVALATGDFNRDGNLDFVAANSAMTANTGSVAILLGRGNGTFSPAVHYAAGPNPTGVATGDFNRDGRLDLAVSNDGTWYPATPGSAYGWGAAMLLATNAGFGAPIRIPLSFPSTAVATLTQPTLSTAAWTNTPGRLAFAGPNLLTLSPLPMSFIAIVPVLPTTLSLAPIAQFSVPGDNRGLAATDLNRDQWMDVAALQTLGGNTGANTSTNVYTVSSRLPTSYAGAEYKLLGPFPTGLDSGFGIVAADFDGDRLGDVVVAGTRSLGPMLPAFVGSIAALPGVGGGSLGAAKRFDVGATPHAIATGRLNRDGRMDLVTTSSMGISGMLNASTSPFSSLKLLQDMDASPIEMVKIT